MNDKDQYVLEKLKRQLELTTDENEAVELQQRIEELEGKTTDPEVEKTEEEIEETEETEE